MDSRDGITHLSRKLLEIKMDDEYVELDSVDGKHIADLIKSYFEANGIPLSLSQESYGAATGLTVAPLGEVHLLVPAGRLEEARDLLREYYAEDQDG